MSTLFYVTQHFVLNWDRSIAELTFLWKYIDYFVRSFENHSFEN